MDTITTRVSRLLAEYTTAQQLNKRRLAILEKRVLNESSIEDDNNKKDKR